MNNITDITILIAVIALTMWPVVLLVLKTMNIRKKRLEHLERMTKTELESISTQELVISVLKKIGCQPEINNEGHMLHLNIREMIFISPPKRKTVSS